VTQVRHKNFITYHHVDQREVDNFIDAFDYNSDVFITSEGDESFEIVG
jgi:hypothetical protein